MNYLDALAAASPRMIALGEHARTYGGRPLVSYAISTPENLARLGEIKAARAAIIDPEATRSWISMGIEVANAAPATEPFRPGVFQT